MTNPEQPEYEIVKDRESTRYRPSAQRYGRLVEVPATEDETNEENDNG